MATKVMVGEGQRFQVIWDWVQPQIEVYDLIDTKTGEKLMRLGSDYKGVSSTDLYRICELLNELADGGRDE